MAKVVQSPAEFLSNTLEKNNISTLKFSKDICLSQSATRLIVIGKTRISVPVAMRLAKYFNTTPEYWLKMQMDWDISVATQDKKLMDVVKTISKFEKGKEPARKAAGKTAAAKAPAKAAKAPAKGKANADGAAKPAAKRGRQAAAKK